MALLADIRTAVRYNLDDPPTYSETELGVDPTRRVYQIPRVGPMVTSSETVDIDGVPKTRNVDYTINYDAAQLYFTAGPPSGGSIHVVWQFNRFRDETLNQYIIEAVRELGLKYPKISKFFHIATVTNSATTTTQYNPTDVQITVNSTAGYAAGPGLVAVGPNVWKYTSVDATHFLGVSPWAGTNPVINVGTPLTQDDNANHGWFPAGYTNEAASTFIRDIVEVRFYDPAFGSASDPFAAGTGYAPMPWWRYEVADGFLQLEADFSAGDNLSYIVRTNWQDPVDGVPLDIPNFCINPVGWLATSLASEAREADRDFAALENKILDVQGNPVETAVKTGDAYRKMWDRWIAEMWRPFTVHTRRSSVL